MNYYHSIDQNKLLNTHKNVLITFVEVVFLCTEDPFPSKRLDQLATAFRLKHNTDFKFEDHIYIKHLTDTVQLHKCLVTELPYFLSTKSAGLIIVDSIAGIYRSDNKNVDYVQRSREFLNICKALNRLQDCYNCAILIVNQVGSAYTGPLGTTLID